MTVLRRVASRSLCFFISTMFVVSLTCASITLAQSRLSADLIERGWEEITFNEKIPNTYAVCGDDCVRVETDKTVSMIGRAVEVDIAKTPVLSWEWRIEAPAVSSDLAKKGGDDRAVAVYVAFEFDPATASLGEILLRPMVKMLRGSDAPGRGLSYVWGGERPQGDLFPNPYQEDSAAVIIQRTAADPAALWFTESVNVVEDYRRAFGADPIGVTHILISADSDDVAEPNAAEVRNLRFASE